ncbi:MAG: PKD domain-containing protein [Acidimicrobiales bacterium]
MKSTVARIALAGTVLLATMTGLTRPAGAAFTTVLSGQFPYQGQGSQTRTFIEDEFTANIPDILAGAGKVKVRFAIETTTKATVRAASTTNVAVEGDLQPGRPLTLRSSQDSLNSILPELALTTRPVLRVVFDYERDDPDPFECSPFLLTGAAPVATGDGDAVCGRFEIGLSDDAMLMLSDFVPPYAGGSVTLQGEQEVFSIPVCAELAGLIGIGPLADICAIRLNAKVEATVSTGDTGGYRATSSLATDLPLPNGDVVRGGRALSPPEVVRWPSPDPVSQTYVLTCLDAGAPLYYRLDNNVYGAKVDRVSIQAAVDFVVAGASVAEIAVGEPFDLLGDGSRIDVTATHGSVMASLGPLEADGRGPQAGPGGPYAGDEGSPIRLEAVATGPGGATGECDPAAVTYEWAFDDGTTATGAVVSKTFADNRPSPHHATLHARDRLGNTTSTPFTVAIANVAPTATITAPAARSIIPLGSTVSFAATAVDPGPEDPLTYAWSFGDGTTRTVTSLSRTDAVAHRYTTPCLCAATLDVSDPEAAAPRQSVEVIAFDPAGKVTGGGGFISDQASVGVAPGTPYRMTASVQYDAGASAPKGLTALDVASVGKSVHATAFDFLVVRGNEATWEGSATLNGTAGYTFRATLVMGSDLVPTATSMTLWRPGTTSPAAPDLRVGGPIDNGQIKTH